MPKGFERLVVITDEKIDQEGIDLLDDWVSSQPGRYVFWDLEEDADKIKKSSGDLILAVGSKVAGKIIGSHFPGLKESNGMLFQPDGKLDSLCLTCYSPSLHLGKTTYRKDLTDHYRSLAVRIDLIMRGETFQPIDMISGLKKGLGEDEFLHEAYLAVNDAANKEIALDIETSQNENDPERKNHMGKATKTETVQISYYSHTEKFYKTRVATSTNWKSKSFYELLRLGTNGTKWLFSGGSFDMSKTLIDSGVMPLDLPFGKMPGYAETYRRARTFFQPKLWEDTAGLSWLRDQNKLGGNDLKTLAKDHLMAPDWSSKFWEWNLDWIKSKNCPKVTRDGTPVRDDKWNLGKIPKTPQQRKQMGLPDGFPLWEDLEIYGAYDAYWQVRLWREVCKDWLKDPNLNEAYQLWKEFTLELMITEWVGFPFQVEKGKKLAEKLDGYCTELEDWVSASIGAKLDKPEFKLNPRSSKQKSELVFTLGLDNLVTGRTPTGLAQLDKTSIQKLVDHEEYGEIFTGLDELVKVKNIGSNFLNPYIKYSSNGDRIHAQFHLMKTSNDGKKKDDQEEGGTESGRVAIRKPGLHNNPNGVEALNRLICVPGMSMITADFKSIEPMVLASISGCQAWLELFDYGKRNPGDPKGDLYCKIWSDIMTFIGKKMTPADVTDPMRDKAKVVVLGYTYDRSPWALAQGLGCSVEEAKQIYKGFEQAYPEILHFSHNNRVRILGGDFPHTLFGRYRTADIVYPPTDLSDLEPMNLNDLQAVLKEIEDPISGSDCHGLRALKNNVIQSAANDLNLLCKRYMAEFCPEDLWHVLAVHDSIKFVGNASQENLTWIYETMGDPKRWLGEKYLKALQWDKWDILRADVSYGPSNWKKSHTKFIPGKKGTLV